MRPPPLASAVLSVACVVADHGDSPGSVDQGTVAFGVVGVACAGLVCMAGARMLALRIKRREADAALAERNERRKKMGLVELDRADADASTV